ncbi:hypothetical protein CDAR_110781 [Caerostris darwini]|nr:hypothetical protein CDAR_110781 [Caerostris darwini]
MFRLDLHPNDVWKRTKMFADSSINLRTGFGRDEPTCCDGSPVTYGVRFRREFEEIKYLGISLSFKMVRFSLCCHFNSNVQDEMNAYKRRKTASNHIRYLMTLYSSAASIFV